MSNVRLIARLDIKGSNLIKGVHLEGLRVVGSPADYALKYYNAGIDEFIYMDSVASLYGRNHLAEIVSSAVKDIFVPITVGGGIRSTDDVTQILRSGADKVAINTAAVANPELIRQVAQRFGSQCVVLSVEAKKCASHGWEVYTDGGRERTGIDVVSWVQQAADLGVGEILLTSVDMEGTRRGFDVALVDAVTSAVSVPVIASGGMGSSQHFLDVVREGGADAVAMADILHYDRVSLSEIRNVGLKNWLKVRHYEEA